MESSREIQPPSPLYIGGGERRKTLSFSLQKISQSGSATSSAQQLHTEKDKTFQMIHQVTALTTSRPRSACAPPRENEAVGSAPGQGATRMMPSRTPTGVPPKSHLPGACGKGNSKALLERRHPRPAPGTVRVMPSRPHASVPRGPLLARTQKSSTWHP